MGVSENVIEASWKALVDAIRLELMRLTEKDETIAKAVEDYCWGGVRSGKSISARPTPAQ